MDNNQNRFLSVHYQLYTIDDNGEKSLEEQTSREHPFQFVSGFGVSLDALERHMLALEKGATFDFTLEPDEAFGQRDPAGVHKLSREVFAVNGKFDEENVMVGSVIPMTDPEHNTFMAKVVNIDSESVTIDTNHPLAGKRLNFCGILLENREATEAEITQIIKMLTGDTGCGGCGECGKGGCANKENGGENKEGGCCGHCH
ncbi:MAG: FKBP-type peptidyl-prolyl cis-trans isomerase [Prevotella sp.]|nr:FKBP-type peptidyl-prolyl cis-trans isomerase [Prevotella sp.]